MKNLSYPITFAVCQIASLESSKDKFLREGKTESDTLVKVLTESIRQWGMAHRLMTEYSQLSDKGLVCPHCEHLHIFNPDNCELINPDLSAWECDKCKQVFGASVKINYEWKGKVKG